MKRHIPTTLAVIAATVATALGFSASSSAASSLTGAGPRLNRSTIARRAGSARA